MKKRIGLIASLSLLSVVLLVLLTSCFTPKTSEGLKMEYGTIADEISGYILVGRGVCPDKDIVIPYEHEGEPVIGIADRAFKNRTTITSVRVPRTVLAIGNEAFNNCESLESVTMQNSVLYLGAAAFGGCESLSSIKLSERLTEIGGSTFRDCKSLEDITLPEGVSEIGEAAFLRCESLVNLTIPKSVTSIGRTAFIGCSSLETLDYAGTVAEWSAVSKAERWCEKTLTSVTCSDGVVTLR